MKPNLSLPFSNHPPKELFTYRVLHILWCLLPPIYSLKIFGHRFCQAKLISSIVPKNALGLESQDYNLDTKDAHFYQVDHCFQVSFVVKTRAICFVLFFKVKYLTGSYLLFKFETIRYLLNIFYVIAVSSLFHTENFGF